MLSASSNLILSRYLLITNLTEYYSKSSFWNVLALYSKMNHKKKAQEFKYIESEDFSLCCTYFLGKKKERERESLRASDYLLKITSKCWLLE